MKSYTNVANRLVELINAADYSGIENLFTKEMSAALPLDKATAFFTGLTAQAGKIQKLDEPERNAGYVFAFFLLELKQFFETVCLFLVLRKRCHHRQKFENKSFLIFSR